MFSNALLYSKYHLAISMSYSFQWLIKYLCILIPCVNSFHKYFPQAKKTLMVYYKNAPIKSDCNVKTKIKQLTIFSEMAASLNLKSQDHLGWTRPLRPSTPTTSLTYRVPPPNHFPSFHVHMALKYLQGWALLHLPGQPHPIPDCLLCAKILPNVQSSIITENRGSNYHFSATLIGISLSDS